MTSFLRSSSSSLLLLREAPPKLVLDAREVTTVGGLRTAHHAIQKWARGLVENKKGGRLVVLLGDDLVGVRAYCRSVAREVGRRHGATVNVVRPANHGAVPTIRFLLSERAAMVTRVDLRLRDAPDAPFADDFDSRLKACLDGDQGNLPEPTGDAHTDVRGSRILITGAAGGIGSALGSRLEAAGAVVACVDKEVDLRDPHQAPLEVSRVAYEAFGASPDAIAHCAGITRDRTLAKMSEAEFDDCLQVNYAAPLAIDRLLRPKRSLVFSSIVGIHGNFGQANYAAAKAALIAYAAAPSVPDSTIRKCIAPGYVLTPMTRNLPFLHRFFAPRLSALGRPVLPEDVAHAAEFLCSPTSDALQSQTLRVCGGSLIG
ncbi:hypothetical protein CTAYLR_000131 [Chrysophaeum taylorii]|uniref:Ketoreductase domain-containing protein n=1 Tax=Chrysophaeum taylorii TaxID=2483200 RepID=A0AAD7UGJ7_9STRA|nr:hypothetical protein CTAYLR_000131 [Chrysophaeum taylorii]